MRDRCDNINQTLMKRKTINDLGVKKYYFLSVARNGEACISIINEKKLEILSADCGESYSIINKWNNIN